MKQPTGSRWNLPRVAKLALAGLLLASLSGTPGWCQDAVRGGKVRAAQGGVALPPGAVPGGAPGQPGQPGAPPDGAAKPGEAKPAEGAKPDEAKTTSRPQKPETPPNPAELQVRPDEEGKVRFSFQGQPWLGVLEWLAAISHLSLDWQEVPGDYLNLRTQRSYTLEEARDVINRHLLDRGFTLLHKGEVLHVVNVKKLDPSLVPRVRLEDLDVRLPHEFVRVSFPLATMLAEAAVEEFKPMISPNGKLNPLKSTNRIEAIDAVANLRDIRDVLREEQSSAGNQKLAREFRLQFVRAAEVLDQLQGLLGLEKTPANAPPESPEQQMMRQQMAMQRMQQQQQQGQQQPQKPKPEIFLVVNQRKNSIIAHAPADQMAVIVEAVKIIDVPSDESQSLLQNAGRMQVHRMSAIDPDVFVKMLNELGELDPTTRLQVDKKNRSVIAYATLADHLTIRTLIAKLDGSDRKFEVIRLRRLEADYVAGTIEFMMGPPEKKQQNNRYNPFYYEFGFGRQQQQEDESRKFKVDADVENNRLLLWANDIELAEIENLLVKLGEVPVAGGNPSKLRVLDSIDPDEADELLRRLRKAVPGLLPNPLQFGPGTGLRDEGETAVPDSEQPAESPSTRPARRKLPATTTGAPRSFPSVLTRDAALEEVALLLNEQEQLELDPATPDEATGEEAEQPAPVDRGDTGDAGPDAPAAEVAPPATGSARPPATRREPAIAPPIRIGKGPDGRLIISSDDPDALDRLEDLVAQIAPPRKDFKIFKMKNKNTWAWGVAENLKDFFEETEKKGGNSRYTYDPWYGRIMNAPAEDGPRRLSKRRPLKFISDPDTNSILVTGADAAQLKTIEELIAIYDVPESLDSAAARLTKVYQIEYSKARIIADAVKEVYRDLLSTNDPAMQQQNQNKQGERPATMSYTYVYGGGGDDGKKPESPLKFKGALSLGVDELSNTLIISAGESLLNNVEQTVRALDEAARPTVPRMQVLRLGRYMDVDDLQKRLLKLTTKPPAPQQPQPGQRPPQMPPQGETPDGSTVTVERFN